MAEFEHINIAGPSWFEDKITSALRLLRHTPSWDTVRALRSISYSGRSDTLAHAMQIGAGCVFTKQGAERDAVDIAASIAHEAAHVRHGPDEGPAETATVQAYRDLGANGRARQRERQAGAIAEGVAEYYRREGGAPVSRTTSAPQLAPQPKADVPWPGWESHDAYQKRMHLEKLKKWGLA